MLHIKSELKITIIVLNSNLRNKIEDIALKFGFVKSVLASAIMLSSAPVWAETTGKITQTTSAIVKDQKKRHQLVRFFVKTFSPLNHILLAVLLLEFVVEKYQMKD